MRWLLLALAIVAGCDDTKSTPDLPYADMGVDRDLDAPDAENPDLSITATRLFPTENAPGTALGACPYASPLAYDSVILQAAGSDIVALDPNDGSQAWRLTLPAPDGESAVIIGTPALVRDKLVVAYYTTDTDQAGDAQPSRLRHRVSVVDLDTRALDPMFETIELEGTLPATGGGTVTFLPSNALARAEVVIGRQAGETFGRAYVTFGNVRDIQPWHGFAFEINLDAWARARTPYRAVW
ncbi:MAG: hypothetical protein R3E66_04885 [bacterium]